MEEGRNGGRRALHIFVVDNITHMYVHVHEANTCHGCMDQCIS